MGIGDFTSRGQDRFAVVPRPKSKPTGCWRLSTWVVMPRRVSLASIQRCITWIAILWDPIAIYRFSTKLFSGLLQHGSLVSRLATSSSSMGSFTVIPQKSILADSCFV